VGYRIAEVHLRGDARDLRATFHLVTDPREKAREWGERIAGDMPDDGWESDDASLDQLIASSAESAWDVDALMEFEEEYGEDGAEEMRSRPGVEQAFKDAYVAALGARLRG
jgi:hypothetical protein